MKGIKNIWNTNKLQIAVMILIFILALLLRIYHLGQNALTFGYDQARDAFVSQQIISGDLKILGPPASTPGLYHGVFYYYFLAPAYWFGNGSPVVAACWVGLFNALGVFIIYILTFLLTKHKFTSLLAAVFYAVSFEATQYSLWLSNPTLGMWSVPLVYLGLWIWISQPKIGKDKKWIGPVIASIGLGLNIQAEIFLAYHIVPVFIWLYIARKKITKRQILIFATGLIATVFSMILVEFKFGFQSIKGISSLVTSGDDVLSAKNLGDFVVLYLNQIGKMFSNNLFPLNAGYGGIIGILALCVILVNWAKQKSKKLISYEPFLATYILSHLSIVTLGGVSTPFLLVGIGGSAVILMATFTNFLFNKSKALAVFICAVIILSNVTAIITKGKMGQVIFSIQKDMLLSNELEALDYIYQGSDGEPFSINTITSPLWINTTWSYLFNWYGKEKYGYLPEWRGKDQVGQLGNNLTEGKADTSLHYLIIEPPQGIPGYYIEWEQNSEDARSELLGENNFGDIKVQKRQIVNENE